ncbi:MAG: LemA family protein [Eubacteriales bacterium]|nr:LemA family protein [Eubacteriales bacterium]MDY2933087.1 LemA family protein [Anaerovoracaceae bacterium]
MSIGLIVVIVIVAILVIWFIAMYNGFVKIKNRVDEAFATIDVYLKKRYDLIPNLVETVKGYAAHESGTLEKVVQARNMAQSAGSDQEKIAADNMLSGTLKSLFAVAEGYPDLKANTNFIDLQNQLKTIEEDIANARKYYNAVVREFNTKREVFPSNIIAGMFGFKARPLYEVETAEERQNVRVQF